MYTPTKFADFANKSDILPSRGVIRAALRTNRSSVFSLPASHWYERITNEDATECQTTTNISKSLQGSVPV